MAGMSTTAVRAPFERALSGFTTESVVRFSSSIFDTETFASMRVWVDHLHGATASALLRLDADLSLLTSSIAHLEDALAAAGVRRVRVMRDARERATGLVEMKRDVPLEATCLEVADLMRTDRRIDIIRAVVREVLADSLALGCRGELELDSPAVVAYLAKTARLDPITGMAWSPLPFGGRISAGGVVGHSLTHCIAETEDGELVFVRLPERLVRRDLFDPWEQVA